LSVRLPRRVFRRTVKPPYVAARTACIGLLERRAGINTRQNLTQDQLGISAENQEAHIPSFWFALRRILPRDEVGPDDVFVDFGSGLGRIVYQAAERYPFKRVVGVELSARAHAIAQENLARTASKLRAREVALVHGDVRDFDVPDDLTVAYIGNPFSGPIFQAVVEKLVESVARASRRLRVIYLNPVEEQRLLDAGFVPVRALRGWRPGAEWSRSNATRMYEIGPRALSEE
jgi:hypothetical protein